MTVATLPFSPTPAGTIWRIGEATVAWVGLIALMAVHVPKRKKTFDDFGLKLPQHTQVVVDTSMWVADSWWVLVPAVLLGLVLVALGYYLIRHVRRSSTGSAVWSFLFVFVPLVLCGLTVFATESAMANLLAGLNR